MLVSDVIRRARSYVGGDRDHLNRADAANDTVTSVVLQYDGHVQVGTRLEVEATGELLHVWAYDAGTKTATVSRGFDGTTAATIPQDAVVRVNPRWTHMMDQVTDELAALASDGLLQMKTATFTELDWDDDLYGIDISAIKDTFLGVHNVEVTFADRRSWAADWRLDENVLWVDFAEADTYVLYYWAGFDAPTTAADDVATLGLRASAHDLLAYGVAYRLLAGRATDRVDHEVFNGARSPEDLSADMPVVVARTLMARRNDRLASELARQFALFPPRHFIPKDRGQLW